MTMKVIAITLAVVIVGVIIGLQLNKKVDTLLTKKP